MCHCKPRVCLETTGTGGYTLSKVCQSKGKKRLEPNALSNPSSILSHAQLGSSRDYMLEKKTTRKNNPTLLLQVGWLPTSGGSTAMGSVSGGSSSNGARAGTPQIPQSSGEVWLLQQAADTVSWGDGVKTKAKAPIHNLLEIRPAASSQTQKVKSILQKNLSHSFLKTDLLAEHRLSLSLRFPDPRGFSATGFLQHHSLCEPLSRADTCTCPAAEVALSLSVLSGFWQVPSLSPSVIFYPPVI